MLTDILLQFKNDISLFNLFEYLTFKTAISAITALIISFIIGPLTIKKLQQYQIGEEIRSNGPESHLAKRGTPTMGGVIIILSTLLPTLLFSDLSNIMVLIIALSTLWMGVIGFIDDYLKIIIKAKDGMIARYKMIGQILLGVIISYAIINSNDFANFGVGFIWTQSSDIPKTTYDSTAKFIEQVGEYTYNYHTIYCSFATTAPYFTFIKLFCSISSKL